MIVHASVVEVTYGEIEHTTGLEDTHDFLEQANLIVEALCEIELAVSGDDSGD